MFSGVTDSLSVILNDNETMYSINQLLAQANLINSSLNIWNGKWCRREDIRNHAPSLNVGTISATKTANDFNQSIPAVTISILFASPVNLSNLHQPWFMNRTDSLSNINVVVEIYLASLQPNYAYVSSSRKSKTAVARSCFDVVLPLGGQCQAGVLF